jgi:hypothetical protein
MAEVPDTTEAVMLAIANAPGCVQDPNSLHFHYAVHAIEADRKALAEAGYLIVKPVSKSAAAWSNHLSALYSLLGKMDDKGALEYLQSLGLPIEVRE